MATNDNQNNDDQNNSERCYLEWMQTQEADLSELLQALSLTEKPGNLLTEVAEKMIKHVQDYMERRIQHAQNGSASCYFAPTWNSCLENSLLWLAGCRPTIFIRLLYALCGAEIETHLQQYIQGIRSDSLGDLSGRQLTLVNALHLNTIKEEEKLSTQLASLQEFVADEPISVIAKSQSRAGESNEEVDRALQEHEQAMIHLLEEADNLRLSTLKELISILTPIQALEYLAASKKLHISLHQWGRRRDLMRCQRD